MPYKVTKKTGSRPYKIINTAKGKQVGSSKTRKAAKASIRARYTGKGKRK